MGLADGGDVGELLVVDPHAELLLEAPRPARRRSRLSAPRSSANRASGTICSSRRSRTSTVSARRRVYSGEAVSTTWRPGPAGPTIVTPPVSIPRSGSVGGRWPVRASSASSRRARPAATSTTRAASAGNSTQEGHGAHVTVVAPGPGTPTGERQRADSNPVQCGFESHSGHRRSADEIDGATAAMNGGFDTDTACRPRWRQQVAGAARGG